MLTAFPFRAVELVDEGYAVVALEKQDRDSYQMTGHNMGHINSERPKSLGGDGCDPVEFYAGVFRVWMRLGSQFCKCPLRVVGQRSRFSVASMRRAAKPQVSAWCPAPALTAHSTCACSETRTLAKLAAARPENAKSPRPRAAKACGRGPRAVCGCEAP